MAGAVIIDIQFLHISGRNTYHSVWGQCGTGAYVLAVPIANSAISIYLIRLYPTTDGNLEVFFDKIGIKIRQICLDL